ncbi:MAG: pantetheine-phosphate adenylyltransferase [Thermoflavifilum sp.]|nr:pantetheine-phosphate adenylyltransferase [Thermoflavifilum sp.]MCL6513329.1 pantetheine-phosphate adenylyltransferase [Alicyclobacillus sp.]
MRRAVYPGSFDPMTMGHLDLVGRAAALFDELVLAVLHNPLKRPLFTVEERMALLKESVRGYDNVRVDQFQGLLVDYVRTHQISVIIRGVREVSDFENELRMAQMNRHLYSGAETVLLLTDPRYGYISSTLVKDVAMHGGSVRGLVPEPVERALASKFPPRTE